METHKYTVDVNGTMALEDYEAYTKMTARLLNESLPEMLPNPKAKPVDHVSFSGSGNNVKEMTIHTYGMLVNDVDAFDMFKNYVEDALSTARCVSPKTDIKVREYAELGYSGTNGDLPKKLYHVCEADELRHIGQEGCLLPGVALVEREHVPECIAWQPDNIKLVILEMDTNKIELDSSKEKFYGKDSSLTDKGYGMYYLSSAVPVEDLNQVIPTRFNSVGRTIMKECPDMMNKASTKRDISLVAQCLRNIGNMEQDVFTMDNIDKMIEAREAVTNIKAGKIEPGNDKRASDDKEMKQFSEAVYSIDETVQAVWGKG